MSKTIKVDEQGRWVCVDCSAWAHAGQKIRHSKRCDTPNAQGLVAPAAPVVAPTRPIIERDGITGTQRQVAWALDIRAKKLAAFEREIASRAGETSTRSATRVATLRTAVAAAAAVTSAKAWIELQDQDWALLLTTPEGAAELVKF